MSQVRMPRARERAQGLVEYTLGVIAVIVAGLLATAAYGQSLQPLEQLLRDSGEFGPAVPVADDASAQDKLIAFIGRDPAWQPPGAPSAPAARDVTEGDTDGVRP